MRNKFYFAFRRAGSAAAKLRILFSDTLKLSPERESVHLIGSRPRRAVPQPNFNDVRRYCASSPKRKYDLIPPRYPPAALSRQAEHSPKSGTKIRKKS